MLKVFTISLTLFVILVSYPIDGLKCFECSSLNNTNCSDPFKANDTLVECPPAPEHIQHLIANKDAQLCRKLKQNIDGKIRVTRNCGYLLNNETMRDDHSCFKDAFTAYTSSFYCSCSGDKCNRSSSGAPPNITVLFILLVITVLNFIKQ